MSQRVVILTPVLTQFPILQIRVQIYYFFLIYAKKSEIFGSDGDLCVSVISRSSVGGESVKRVVCGGGIGDSWRRNRRPLAAE